jgi:hypothetical protein
MEARSASKVPAVKAGSLVERIHGARAISDPTASPDFEGLRVLRRKFSRGGLPAIRAPEDDARIAVFYVVKALLDLLAELARRVQRGEPVRLLVSEQSSIPGRMTVEVRLEPANQQLGGTP